MKLSGTATKILAIASILILPSIAYLLISRGENDYERLLIYGPKDPAPNGVDTVYHKIAPFILTDHYGAAFSSKNLDDKIFVAEFFFATCKTICPKMTMQMKRVQEAYADDSEISLVSYTVNPAADSVPVLAAYAQKHGARKNKWFFLTGDKKVIYDLARTSYLVAAGDGDGSEHDFIHTQNLVLIDKEMRIRGYYDGTDYQEVNRLIDEIKVLKWEYAKANGRKSVW
ncbi:MAG: SCO family protein [Bacteroidota bacterium]